MLSPTYEITTALSHTDELISPPYDIAIVTISYGRVIMSSVWDSMMSKKNVGWPFYAAVLRTVSPHVANHLCPTVHDHRTRSVFLGIKRGYTAVKELELENILCHKKAHNNVTACMSFDSMSKHIFYDSVSYNRHGISSSGQPVRSKYVWSYAVQTLILLPF